MVRWIRFPGMLFMTVLIPAAAMAGELRIIDDAGLVRALTTIESESQVTIELDGWTRASAEPRLIPISGLGAAVNAMNLGAGRYVFSGVSEGSWRIEIPSSERVRTVQVRAGPR